MYSIHVTLLCYGNRVQLLNKLHVQNSVGLHVSKFFQSPFAKYLLFILFSPRVYTVNMILLQ